MTRPPRNIRVDPSHVVNTGRIRRDINPGPNSMFPEYPGANDDIAVFELRDGNFHCATATATPSPPSAV